MEYTTDTRKEAIQWWNKLALNYKKQFAKMYIGDRSLESLTGREIDTVYTYVAKYFTRPDYMESIGFQLLSDDGNYLKYENKSGYESKFYGKMARGKVIIYFNREYVIKEGYIFMSVREDGGTRTAFNGAVANDEQMKLILKLIM